MNESIERIQQLEWLPTAGAVAVIPGILGAAFKGRLTVLRGLNLFEVCFYALPLTLGVFCATFAVLFVVSAGLPDEGSFAFGLIGVTAGIAVGGVLGAWISGGDLTGQFERFAMDTFDVPVGAGRMFFVAKAALFIFFVMQFYFAQYGAALAIGAITGGAFMAIYATAKVAAAAAAERARETEAAQRDAAQRRHEQIRERAERQRAEAHITAETRASEIR